MKITSKTYESIDSLEVLDTWQTKARGTNEQEYEIYRSCAKDLGWEIKTFEEWLNT